MNEDDVVALLLPRTLYERTRRRAEEVGLGSAEEYVTRLLEEVLTRVSTETDISSDREEIERRLRGLGYLSE